MGLKDRLSQLRINHKMTMEQVGEKVGASKVAVSRWEKGERTPKKEYLKAYADYFNVSIDWIKYGELEDYICRYLEEKTLEEHKDELNSFECCEERATYENDLVYPLYYKAEVMAQLWNKKRYPTFQEIEQLCNKLAKPVDYKETLTVQEYILGEFVEKFFYLMVTHHELNNNAKESLNRYCELLKEAEKQARKTLKLLS